MIQRIVWLILLGLLIALGVWIANRTYWAETVVPLPPKGEALTNPYYVAQKFATALGAKTVRDRAQAPLPAADAIIVLSDWHWGLSAARRDALKRWVESGGRLVVDRSLVGGEEDLADWAGIETETHEEEAETETETEAQDEPEEPPQLFNFRPACREAVLREGDGDLFIHRLGSSVSICGFDAMSTLVSHEPAAWALHDKDRVQVVSVPVGKGSVTAINAVPFRFRGMFDGGHGALFVLATQLKRGDKIHFRTEADHPSVFTLMWRYGAPVVALVLAFVALGIWRGAVRLGPVIAEPERARRSLAEQIRGTGQFSLRFGKGEALRRAAVRALEEAAQRRVPGFAHLPASDRVEKLAELTHRDTESLRHAILVSGPRRPNELRSAVALLEAARRDLLAEKKRN